MCNIREELSPHLSPSHSNKAARINKCFKLLTAMTLLVSQISHGDRHLGMGACFHGNFFAIFLMVS